MRRILSERNIVVVLFVMVLITFSLAHEDCKEMERIYIGFSESVSEPVAPLADNQAIQHIALPQSSPQ
jgi:hypothetical protein